MKTILMFLLAISIFFNLHLFFLERHGKNQSFYFEMGLESSSKKNVFFSKLFSSGVVNINRSNIINYLENNSLTFSERKEKNYYYVSVEGLTFSFNLDGDFFGISLKE